MKDLFLPYELAVKLKEKGFDEPCLTYYLNKTFCFGSSETGKADSIGKNLTNSSWCGNNFASNSESLFVSAPLYQQVVNWVFLKFNEQFEHNLKLTIYIANLYTIIYFLFLSAVQESRFYLRLGLPVPLPASLYVLVLHHHLPPVLDLLRILAYLCLSTT